MHTLDRTELLETLVAHTLAYSYLGKAFYESPTVEFMNTLQQDALFDEWPLDGDNDTLREGLALLREYCADWDETAFDALKSDYARLFVGPNRLLAPPWESVYRGDERLLFEEETFQVRALYRQYGLAPAGKPQPDDHFGLEMFFVAHLCRLGLDALEQDQGETLAGIRQTLDVIFTEHISQWAEPFLADVKAHAVTPYYQGLALLARGCIIHTMAVLPAI